MAKIKKVFLPFWQRKVMVPLFFIIWLFVTYEEFFGPSAGELGMIGYLVMTLIFLGLVVMMWLMTGGKLPAYVIKEEDDNNDSKNLSL